MLFLSADDSRKNKSALAAGLRVGANRAAFDAIALEGAPHGMENWEGRPEWMDYKTKLAEWLKAKLAPRK